VCQLDQMTLAGICQMWAEYQWLSDQWKKCRDLRLKLRLSARRESLYHELRIAAAEFGLTPNGRVKIAPDTLRGSQAETVEQFARKRG